jgi:hypothetical protein
MGEGLPNSESNNNNERLERSLGFLIYRIKNTIIEAEREIWGLIH